MGVFESSFLFYGYTFSGEVGKGAYKRLCDNPSFEGEYKQCATDMGGKAFLHAPGKFVQLSALDAATTKRRLTLDDCRTMLRSPPSEFPGTTPTGFSNEKCELFLATPPADHLQKLALVKSWAVPSDEQAPRWYYMTVTTSTYGPEASFDVIAVEQ